jgi:ADP-ribose pyrophosphatase
MARELFVGKHLKLLADGRWEFAERTRATGGVAILAFTTRGELLLVEQFRPPVGKRVISLPAGLTGDGDGEGAEEAATSALRELEEETGYRSKTVHPLAVGPSSPGLTSEMMTFFRAEGVEKVAGAEIDSAEEITPHAVPRAELQAWLRAREAEGILIDYKIYAALYLAEREGDA